MAAPVVGRCERGRERRRIPGREPYVDIDQASRRISGGRRRCLDHGARGEGQSGSDRRECSENGARASRRNLRADSQGACGRKSQPLSFRTRALEKAAQSGFQPDAVWPEVCGRERSRAERFMAGMKGISMTPPARSPLLRLGAGNSADGASTLSSSSESCGRIERDTLRLESQAIVPNKRCASRVLTQRCAS